MEGDLGDLGPELALKRIPHGCEFAMGLMLLRVFRHGKPAALLAADLLSGGGGRP
jgi:hypothetical protein